MKKIDVKKILMYGSLFTLLLGCDYFMNKKKTDLEDDNLNGKVKSVKEIEYNAIDKFGKIQKGEKSTYGDSKFTLYNKDGNKIKDSVGSLLSKDRNKIIYKYDSGNRIEESWYKSDGSLEGKGIYKYIYYLIFFIINIKIILFL